MNCESHTGRNCKNCKVTVNELNKQNVGDIMNTLLDQLHDMRRSGERDLRTVIHHVDIANKAIRDLKEVSQ